MDNNNGLSDLKCDFLFSVFGHSVEKDGSPMSYEKQTVQTSLFMMLKDFLKSPTLEELHSVLAYILAVGEEQQVGLTYFISLCLQGVSFLTFSV